MEGTRHLDQILIFITAEKPDCLCLLEMPAGFIHTLIVLGYYPIFAPMVRDTVVSPGETLGVCIATRAPSLGKIVYYDGSTTGILPHISRDTGITTSFPLVIATYNHTDGKEYTIATVHMMVTDDGHESIPQHKSVQKLLQALHQLPAHILCGDFNMPRGYNTNYNEFIKFYIDTIPLTYSSSLDRTLHRQAGRTDLNAPIFDIYMVDYIFSQIPYVVSNVELRFAISDHAAVVAHISKS